MSHEITELAEGVHTFLSVREHAWHRLGTVVPDDINALDAMKIAKLTDWNVRKLPMNFTSDIDGSVQDVNAKFAAVFTNPVTGKVQQLGTVGNIWTPVQNETHADLLDALVDESGANIETLGSMRDGRDTFVSMKLPETMQVGGVDAVDMYVVALNNHSGEGAFRFIVTPVRVVCKNTEQAAIASAKASFSIRHTTNSGHRIAEAREALGLTWKYVEAFELEAERMIAQTITDAQFAEITKSIFGDPEKQSSARGKTNVETHIDAVTSLWNESATLQNVKGTAWAGYNTITEYADHFMDIRTKRDVATRRAERSVLAKPVTRLKTRAFAAFSA